MACYQVIASLSGGRKKSLPNRSEDAVLAECVMPFITSGVLRARWGSKTQSYQVLELRVYRTQRAWNKASGTPLEEFIGGGARNLFTTFEKRAKKAFGNQFRVFVIMPIQGDKYGKQEDQRIHKEYDERFVAIEALLAKYDSVAIRIDKEVPLDDLVRRIKEEIGKAQFVIADLTDERPSCYFEAGFAEASSKPIVYIASNDSVMKPGVETKIHFDVHMNVNRFSNHQQLKEKLTAAIEKNRAKLFPEPTEPIV